MMLKEKIARNDSRSVRTYCTRTAVVLAATSEIIGSWSMWSMTAYRMSMYAIANSCVHRLNTEGGRDPVSQLNR